MIVRDYGEPQRRGLDMNAPCPRYGWPNTVVCSRTSHTAYPEHLGPLSLKMVLSGQETIEVGAARYAVTPGRYLLLNGGQKQGHSVDEPTEVFTVMFRAGLVEEVAASLTVPAERLLEDPEHAPPPVQFFERTYPSDPRLSQLLSKLRLSLGGSDINRDALEHHYHPILERLLHLHKDIYKDVEKLTPVRHTTKVELYRRLWRARDFIEASFTGDIDLEQMASVACLSPHHFLRLFKKVFGETPHKYLTRRRLEHAQYLLQAGHSVTDTCFDVGFESLGSFSHLFKKRTGVPPSAFRSASAFG